MRDEFSRKTKAQAFERAGGRCEICTAKLMPGRFVYDHRLPDWFDGANDLANCVVQCSNCDKPKTAKDQADIAKSKRVRDRHTGALPRSKRGFRSWRRFSGEIVRRDD